MAVEQVSDIPEHIKNCTVCGAKLEGNKTEVTLHMRTAWNTGAFWEDIKNSQSRQSEVICLDCFEAFAKKMEKFLGERKKNV